MVPARRCFFSRGGYLTLPYSRSLRDPG